MDAIYFWLFGTVAVVASLLVVGQRNPMYSVLLLIASFGALSALYILLDAPFVAAIQIIIYAGAIMVLFLFVVMLLNVPTEDPPAGYHARLLGGAGPRRFGAVLAVVLAAELYWALHKLRITPFPREDPAGAPSVYQIGVKLFTEYAFAFEVTSVLILVAMVGAVILARKEPVAETEHETRVELEGER
jgi:NADH-quinone oxidoreductase subunit J